MPSFLRNHPVLSVVAVIAGSSLGIGMGLPLSRGQSAVAVIGVASLVALFIAVRAVPPERRVAMFALVTMTYGIRIAIAAGLYYGSLASGRGGFVTGDDANYAGLAWGWLQWLSGAPSDPYVPPLWNSNAYLFGTFVYLEAAVFFVFGPTPLAMTALNALFASLFVVILYDIARQLWDERPAWLTAIAVAIYPSLIVWSALNLKDALALLLVAGVFWLLRQMQARPSWYLLASAAVLLIALEGLRRYLFVGLVVLFPLGVWLAATRREHRIAWAGASTAVSAALLLFIALAGSALVDQAKVAFSGFVGLEHSRQEMAAGARTAFVDTPALPVKEGDTYVVVDPSATTAPAPSAEAQPTPTPHVVVVAPGAHLVLASSVPAGASSTPTPAPTTSETITVNPGDIVVVSSSAAATAAPSAARQNLVLRRIAAADNVQLVSAGADAESLALTRTISYVPRGLAYALFAPFPWEISRLQDLATVPEMLFWYLALACLPFSLLRVRGWRQIAPLVLYVAGLLGLFVLVEGNIGTLYRHRAMVIPFVVLLASPTLVALFARLRRVALFARLERRTQLPQL